jgi:Fic family protein
MVTVIKYHNDGNKPAIFMAIFQAPTLDELDLGVLELIEAQKERLRVYSQNGPARWLGSLRRSTLARAIRGSNSIEGYNATLDEALAAVEDEGPVDDKTETWKAITGYRNALTYIGQAARDPYFEFSKQFLKSLHFMMIGHDLSKFPGQWRPGAIFVVNQRTGETVYQGPDVELINDLIEELVVDLRADTGIPRMVKAAMAHLNLTMIHPFKDGNGRMARALQTLVIALGGDLHPIFSSIEEWLGENTEEYYLVLAITGQGTWHPERNAQLWMRFCLKAHYQQAATLIRRNEEYARLFDRVVALLEERGLPDRASVPLFDAALGFRLTNARYRGDAEVTELVASRDLKRLCEAGLLVALGEKRGRVYRAALPLTEARAATRMPRPMEDPYELVTRRLRRLAAEETPRLPGL